MYKVAMLPAFRVKIYRQQCFFFLFSNRSMQNTEEPVTQKGPKETTPDKKHICGKCGEYVLLSQEEWIGNQVRNGCTTHHEIFIRLLL